MSLLDLPQVGASDIAAAEAAAGRLLGTTNDVLLLQAEAVVALEATAKSLGRPGLRALAVITGPYGALFGRWLTGAGADVMTLEVPFDRTVTVTDVREALSHARPDLVAVVHAEAATGGANPIDQIAQAVAAFGAMLVVDAVASVGGHPVTPDAWVADVVVIGAQKALAGPAGVSALSISSRAWQAIDENPSAPRESVLSLADLRTGWLATDKSTLLGTPSSLETAAFLQALARVADEGLAGVIHRHRAAAVACRAAIRRLGLEPWITDDDSAASVVTTVAAPAGWSATDIANAARTAGSRLITAAPGRLAATTFRIGHTGRNANLASVLVEITALANALERPARSRLEAAETGWAQAI